MFPSHLPENRSLTCIWLLWSWYVFLFLLNTLTQEHTSKRYLPLFQMVLMSFQWSANLLTTTWSTHLHYLCKYSQFWSYQDVSTISLVRIPFPTSCSLSLCIHKYFSIIEGQFYHLLSAPLCGCPQVSAVSSSAGLFLPTFFTNEGIQHLF